MAQRWSSWPRSVRLSAVGLAIAGLLVGLLAIRALFAEPPVPLPTVSNGWVAFTVEENNPNGASDIYLVRPGAAERALIGVADDGVREDCPHFSTDGTRIAYLSGPTGPFDLPGRDEIRIVTVAAGGFTVGAPRIVADHLDGYACPAWSPDGARVAFITGGTLSIVGLDGGSVDLEAGPSSLETGAFDWSPAGTEIAYIGPSGIWVAPVDGPAPRRIYETDPDVQLSSLDWSPDGQRIAATGIRFSLQERFPTRIIRVDGSADPVELGGFRQVTWSPDGRRLAAVRTVTRGTFDWSQIVTMTADGGDMRVVADEQWAVQALTWSPDGAELAFVDGQGPSPGLFAVAASGGAAPRFLLSEPYTPHNTGSHDLSWQSVPLQ